MITTFHTITPASTHLGTARAVLDYLASNPADLPRDDAETRQDLAVVLEGTGMALHITDVTGWNLAVFPGVAMDYWVLTGTDIGLGAGLIRPHITSTDPEHTARTLSALRVCIMRATRYAKTRAKA